MTRVGDPMEQESGIELRHALELGRPELKALMNRYSGHDASRSQTSILARFATLIVEYNGRDEKALRDEIESNGWLVKTCPGPGSTRCPLMHAQNCTLRESVDAAIVFLDPKQMWPGTGTLPRLRCAADSASPAVVVLEGRLDARQEAGTTATIGGVRGPKAILAALRRLLQRAS